eukprot:1238050-Amphidinium_carterae.2
MQVGVSAAPQTLSQKSAGQLKLDKVPHTVSAALLQSGLSATAPSERKATELDFIAHNLVKRCMVFGEFERFIWEELVMSCVLNVLVSKVRQNLTGRFGLDHDRNTFLEQENKRLSDVICAVEEVGYHPTRSQFMGVAYLYYSRNGRLTAYTFQSHGALLFCTEPPTVLEGSKKKTYQQDQVTTCLCVEEPKYQEILDNLKAQKDYDERKIDMQCYLQIGKKRKTESSRIMYYYDSDEKQKKLQYQKTGQNRFTQHVTQSIHGHPMKRNEETSSEKR